MKRGILLLFLVILTPQLSSLYAIHPVKEKLEHPSNTNDLSRKEKRALKKQHRKEKRALNLLKKIDHRRQNKGGNGYNLFLLGLILLGVALLLALISLIVSVFGLLGFIAKLFAIGGLALVIIGLL